MTAGPGAALGSDGWPPARVECTAVGQKAPASGPHHGDLSQAAVGGAGAPGAALRAGAGSRMLLSLTPGSAPSKPRCVTLDKEPQVCVTQLYMGSTMTMLPSSH